MPDLSVQAIQGLRPGARYIKKTVSRGLMIGVATSGEKTFIVRYSVKGRPGHPEYRLPKPFGLKSDAGHTSLADARALAAEVLALGKQGIDYKQQLEDQRAAAAALATEQATQNLTVNDLYEAWVATLVRKDGGAEVRRLFIRDILPRIGTMLLSQIEEGHVRTTLKAISSSGKNRTATMLLSLLKQMFRWANGRKPWKMLVDDPVINLKPADATQAGYEEVERERVLSENEIRQLVSRLPDAKLIPTTELVIWLTLACCTRVGETVMAEWAHVDIDNGRWYIPEANTKGKSPAHLIYLSEFAKDAFRRLKTYTGNSKWCFPNDDDSGHVHVKAPTKQISDRQAALRAKQPLTKRSSAPSSLVLGSEKWTPHDLRRTGLTLMQSLGIESHIIELVANHAEPNRMKRIYQRFGHDEEKQEAWIRLGCRLAELTS